VVGRGPSAIEARTPRTCIDAVVPVDRPLTMIAASGASSDAGSAWDFAGTYRAVDFAGAERLAGLMAIGTIADAEVDTSRQANAPATIAPTRTLRRRARGCWFGSMPC
jgi:hypothetical protein